MTIDKNFINKAIEYIDNEHKNKSDWYVGIATRPKDRLFIDHNVNEHSGKWIYSAQMTEQTARDTEKYLLDNYSFKGGVGGGDRPCYVYVYKITSYTRE